MLTKDRETLESLHSKFKSTGLLKLGFGIIYLFKFYTNFLVIFKQLRHLLFIWLLIPTKMQLWLITLMNLRTHSTFTKESHRDLFV